MSRVGEHEVHSPVPPASDPVSTQERWTALYGPLLAQQLRPHRCYALLRVGTADFAYTDFDRYLRALGQAWEAGYVPDPLPSTLGTDLAGVAPNLQGVDLDLADLRPDDVEPPQPRFT